MFQLHSQLAEDTYVLGDFPLSIVLLAKDANYPWCILVPKKTEIREIHQLDKADRQQLLVESYGLAEAMEKLFQPKKMNIAALGNMVPQLHIHHIARFDSDAAWPAPVWGKVPAIVYENRALEERVEILRRSLANLDVGFQQT